MFYDIIVNADVVEDSFNYGVVKLRQPANTVRGERLFRYNGNNYIQGQKRAVTNL
jgi:hypothetical protein